MEIDQWCIKRRSFDERIPAADSIGGDGLGMRFQDISISSTPSSLDSSPGNATGDCEDCGDEIELLGRDE